MLFAWFLFVYALDCVYDFCSFWPTREILLLQRTQHSWDQPGPLIFFLHFEAKIQHYMEDLGHKTAMTILMWHQFLKIVFEILRINLLVGSKSFFKFKLLLKYKSHARTVLVLLHDGSQVIHNRTVLFLILKKFIENSFLFFVLTDRFYVEK